MNNIVTGISVLLFLITMYSAVKGLDLRTRKGWFFMLCGFLAGLSFGLSGHVDLINSIFYGFFVSLLIAYTGLSHLRINRWASKTKYFKKDQDNQ